MQSFRQVNASTQRH